MANFTNKQHRTINRHLDSLFRKKSFENPGPERIKELGINYFNHELKLKSGNYFFLSNEGLDCLNKIEEILLTSPTYFSGTILSDIPIALRQVIGDCLSENLRPEDSKELMELIGENLAKKRDYHWFIAPTNGLELREAESISLGGLKLIKLSLNALTNLGVKLNEKINTLEALGSEICLVGKIYGTMDYAKERFQFQADLTIGVLAIIAGICYEGGAASIRIALEMSPYNSHSIGRYALWQESNPDIGYSVHYGNHQPLEINQKMIDYIQSDSYIQHAFNLNQKENITKLEKALVRSLFWYSDAHRDTVKVMQLVKYWSCAEAFFSEQGEAITKTVSEGVASLLVFGKFDLKNLEEFEEVIKKLVKMYCKRSKAVHDAQYEHITNEDIATLSQWTAYMILEILVLIVDHDFKSPDEIKSASQQLMVELKKIQSKTENKSI